VPHLGLDQVTYITYTTDNQLLATNFQQQDFITQAANWRMRPLLADFLNNHHGKTSQCRKIPRTANTTAHRLARGLFFSDAS
jgi:hypothetical protein